MEYGNWIKWWQTDIPCRFTQQRALENSRYLITLLGEKWLAKRTKRKHKTHPIANQWNTEGAGAFLELNALAEDLRLLDKKENFNIILRDIKSTNEYAATIHVVHCAAMFERADPGIVLKFHPQTSLAVPDFSISLENIEIPVEAKLLTNSKHEVKFLQEASNLSNKIKNGLKTNNRILPEVIVVVKSIDNFPNKDDVLKKIEKGMTLYKGTEVVGRFDKMNIFIRNSYAIEKDFIEHSMLTILCPRNERENLRMESRVKKSSKQLKKYDSSLSGIVCIRLDKHQEPFYLKDRLLSRFNNKQLKSIGSVVLMKCGTYMGMPERSTIDEIAIVNNVNAVNKVQTKSLKFQPIGLLGVLDTSNMVKEVSAYRHMIVRGKLKKKYGGLFMPDRRTLTSEMMK